MELASIKGLCSGAYAVQLVRILPVVAGRVDLAEPQRAQRMNENDVEQKIILELKSVERISNAHKKQLLTYLKLTGMRLGYLLNFGEALMKDGITRTVNRLPE